MIKYLFSSKKRFFSYTILAIVGTFFIIAAKYPKGHLEVKPQAKSAYKAVIFDVGDVLLTTSSSTQRSIFLPLIYQNPSLLYYLMTMNVKEEYFKQLAQITSQSQEPVFNKGRQMPTICSDWMCGHATLDELQSVTCAHINGTDLPAVVKTLFIHISKFMFDAHLLTSSQIQIDQMVLFLQKLKDAGYKTYVLSNWDPYSYPVIREKFTHIFDQFDGIMTSGEEKLAKPNPEFFKRLFERYNLNPEECIFIDDEPYNIATAQDLGLTAIQHTNPSTTFKQLMVCGILQIVH